MRKILVEGHSIQSAVMELHLILDLDLRHAEQLVLHRELLYLLPHRGRLPGRGLDHQLSLVDLLLLPLVVPAELLNLLPASPYCDLKLRHSNISGISRY